MEKQNKISIKSYKKEKSFGYPVDVNTCHLTLTAKESSENSICPILGNETKVELQEILRKLFK